MKALRTMLKTTRETQWRTQENATQFRTKVAGNWGRTNLLFFLTIQAIYTKGRATAKKAQAP